MFYSFIKIILSSMILLSIGFTSLLNEKDSYSNHLELFIHQDIINNFLSSIGKIEGKGKIGGFDYNWKVSNLKCIHNHAGNLDIFTEKPFKILIRLKSEYKGYLIPLMKNYSHSGFSGAPYT